MIRLKNVSKFYYNKGVIASGFTKVNLEFNIGEFVAITGESGSGKSTLLNVISGLDSYEEGEMYINGEETSHYSEKDFEDYRRKYIGNIFQSFNLVNSYTVYQNVELVLLLNGAKKKEVKSRVLELIKKVDLYRFRNTKVSKLSGGQKQRVAIARALAKNTPIIIADEPTGNLDSKSVKGIVKLLSEISKDKLVIIVTHNYEQVEDYVTRKIKMHDGKVLEDKKLKTVGSSLENTSAISYKNITFANKIRLGLRNTFNIIPKFVLLFAVYLFVTVALLSEYASFKREEYEASIDGYNYVFNNTSEKRIVINKKDKTPFNDDDYDKIKKMDTVERVEKVDFLLDSYVTLTNDENFYISGTGASLDSLNEKPSVGRMPENENEVVLLGSRDDYYLGTLKDELMETNLYLTDTNTGQMDKNKVLKVVGIIYKDDIFNGDVTIYLNNTLMNQIKFQINQMYSNTKVLFMNQYYESESYNYYFKVMPNSNVPSGQVFTSSDLNGYCDKGKCINQPLRIEVGNLYYQDALDLVITNMYQKNNMNSLLGIGDYESYNGAVFVNVDDYNRLFNKGTYQSSVFVKEVDDIEKTISNLEDLGYHPLAIKDTLVSYNATQVIRIIKTIVTVILVATLFFISYFIIKIILKSRNVYFSTIRMLGGTKKVSKQLLMIELLTITNLAYILFLGFIYLNYLKVFSFAFVNNMIGYLKVFDYIVLYFILIGMSYLICRKYSKKLFKDSVMKTLAEEV